MTPPTDRSSEALRRLALERPDDAGIQMQLGTTLFDRQEFDDAADAFARAHRLLPGDPRPLALLGWVYLSQGRDSEAVDVVQRALQLGPGHPDALFVFGLLSARLAEPEALEMAIQLLWQSGQDGPRIERLRRERTRLRQRSPAPSPPTVATAAPAPRRAWASDEVAIYCGHTRHAWSPRSLETGVGGSEEAVIRLARELAALGWRVTVFNHVGDAAGTYDGVVYRPFETFNRDDAFNVLVGWRNVRLFDHPFEAAQTYLWLHDYPNPELYARSRLARIGRIMVLSSFHRAALPRIEDDRFLITANGIDLAPFERLDEAPPRRDPLRCIYASSYDRGLEPLLLEWGAVRRAVPGAELHVFYGWDSFAPVAHDPTFQAWKARMEELLAQDGVHEHGRVGADEILHETARSGLLAYPCTFPETSCITAMKAQAAGAVPVVLAYGALAETVRYGIKVEARPDGSCPPEKRAEYRDRLIWALQHPEWQDRVRAEMMPATRQLFGWTGVARQWHETFRTSGRLTPTGT